MYEDDPAGEGVRSARRGDVRRRSARPRDHRPRGGDLRHPGGRDRAPSTPTATRPRTSSSPPPARSTTTSSSQLAAERVSGRGSDGDAARPRRLAAGAVRAARRSAAPLRAQGHRAVPRLPRRHRALAPRRPPLRAARARHDLRRHLVVAAVPGGPRAARPGLRRSTRSPAPTRTPARSACTSARGPTTWSQALAVVGQRAGRDLRPSRPPTEELKRAKENLKGRVVLALESTGARMNRLGSEVLAGAPLMPHRRGRAADRRASRRRIWSRWPRSCGHPSGCRPPASVPTRNGSRPALAEVGSRR